MITLWTESLIASTGNAGLDVILKGGPPARRLYLLEGAPGSGKTTLALQFLREGVRLGERALYITLSETREELAVVAASHGWSIDDFDIFEFDSASDVLGEGREQSILHPWEMELGETVRLIQEQVERVQPKRVVFDSLSEMRLLAQGFAAVPPSGARAEAVLRGAGYHRHPGRRHDRQRSR